MAKLSYLFCKIKRHAIKISGEVKVKIRALLASEIDGAECSSSGHERIHYYYYFSTTHCNL